MKKGRRVAWLKTKRDEIGLTALAKMLDVDAANLGKVIEGKRKPSQYIRKLYSTIEIERAHNTHRLS